MWHRGAVPHACSAQWAREIVGTSSGGSSFLLHFLPPLLPAPRPLLPGGTDGPGRSHPDGGENLLGLCRGVPPCGSRTRLLRETQASFLPPMALEERTAARFPLLPGHAMGDRPSASGVTPRWPVGLPLCRPAGGRHRSPGSRHHARSSRAPRRDRMEGTPLRPAPPPDRRRDKGGMEVRLFRAVPLFSEIQRVSRPLTGKALCNGLALW